MKQIIKRLVPKRVWGKMHIAKIKHDIKNFSGREVKHTYGGYPLTVYLGDGLGEGWYDHDWDDLTEIELLKKNQLRAGATVFDLGAHQAVVALMLSKIVEDHGKVIALEANAHNAEIAERNRKLNQADHLIVLHAAAAEKQGTIFFDEELNGAVVHNSSAVSRIEVPAYSVDALTEIYGSPHALFIDVEGYECHVLRGAKETLRGLPDCYVEVHAGTGLEQSGGSPEEVAAFFSSECYDLYLWSDEMPVPRIWEGSPLPSSRFFLVALQKNIPQ